jgi:hypothetical protein
MMKKDLLIKAAQLYGFDTEESYNVKCLVEGLSWFGFYSDIFDVESPFEVKN